MKVICNFSVLMKLAHELGQARLSRDEDRIALAQENHDAYMKICLESDEMIVPAIRDCL